MIDATRVLGTGLRYRSPIPNALPFQLVLNGIDVGGPDVALGAHRLRGCDAGTLTQHCATRHVARRGVRDAVAARRSAGDEQYDAEARVLAGERDKVITLPMTPGTLLVFAGRYSLHRVSPISGSTPRLVALLGYDTKPGTMSSDLLKEVRYGRVA